MTQIRGKAKEINAADIEHIGALAAGGLLLLKGLQRRDALGLLYAMAGAGFIYRGQNGYRRLYDLLGIELKRCPTGVTRRSVRVESRVVVNRSRGEIYRIWRELSNLPVFMEDLLSVHEIDDTYSLWAARAPGGMVIKWEAKIINDIPDRLIAWESLEGSGVDIVGSVHFEDAGEESTLIRVVLRYDPPADVLGQWIARLFMIDPQRQIERDLRRFKRILELGDKRERHREKTSLM